MPNIIPYDFGKPGGTQISNSTQILKDIDGCVGIARVSYLFARPVDNFRFPFLGFGLRLFGLGSSYTSYGHSAVRLRFDDGRDMVVNIEGKVDGKNMVRFYDTQDYMFGLKDGKMGSQGGIYQRSFIEMRLNNSTNEQATDMLNYYKRLRDHHNNGNASFHLFLGSTYDVMRNIFPSFQETGNCARWVSKGMKKVGIIDSVTMWPKSIAIDLFENRKDVTIVFYERVSHCDHWHKYNDEYLEIIAPFNYLRQFAYSNFQNTASLKVYVPSMSMTAKIEECKPNMRPSRVRNIANSDIVILLCIAKLVYCGWRICR